MKTTDPGYTNRNGQINLGRTDPPRPGTDRGQSIYVLRCPSCSRNYGANGTDIWQRRCPFHDGGKPGLLLTPAEHMLDDSAAVTIGARGPERIPTPDQDSEVGTETKEVTGSQVSPDVPIPSQAEILAGQTGPIRRLLKKSGLKHGLERVAFRLKKLW